MNIILWLSEDNEDNENEFLAFFMGISTVGGVKYNAKSAQTIGATISVTNVQRLKASTPNGNDKFIIQYLFTVTKCLYEGLYEVDENTSRKILSSILFLDDQMKPHNSPLSKFMRDDITSNDLKTLFQNKKLVSK